MSPLSVTLICSKTSQVLIGHGQTSCILKNTMTLLQHRMVLKNAMTALQHRTVTQQLFGFEGSIVSENRNSTATNRKQSVINSETSGPLTHVVEVEPELQCFVVKGAPLRVHPSGVHPSRVHQ